MSVLCQKQRHIDTVKHSEMELGVKVGFPFREAIMSQQALYRQQIKLGILVVGTTLLLLINFMHGRIISYQPESPGSKVVSHPMPIQESLLMQVGEPTGDRLSPRRFAPLLPPIESLIIRKFKKHHQSTPLDKVRRATSARGVQLQQPRLSPSRKIYRLAALTNITPQQVLRYHSKTNNVGGAFALSKSLSSPTIVEKWDSDPRIYLDGLSRAELKQLHPLEMTDQEPPTIKLRKREMVVGVRELQLRDIQRGHTSEVGGYSSVAGAAYKGSEMEFKTRVKVHTTSHFSLRE
jgi:hypothetical protein